MKKCSKCFQEEIKRISDKLKKKRQNATLMFALVADSHLDDWEEDTCYNIQAVDAAVEFDFIVHLGDFMNGNISKGYTKRILEGEMKKFRSAVGNGVLYPVQGNHDGYCDLSAEWIVHDVVLNEDWYEATCFAENYKGLVRKKGAPYYYVDYPEKKVRLIFLCSFCYTFTEEGKYQKLYQMDERQLLWLEEEALLLEREWTVLLFSHDGPLQFYNQEKYYEEPWEGNNKELIDTLLEMKKKFGFSVAAWFVGHWHGELCSAVEEIPFVLIGSQTCYVPQLWFMPNTGHYEQRERGRITQDLWDAVVLDVEKREIELCRFGAGKDRIISY